MLLSHLIAGDKSGDEANERNVLNDDDKKSKENKGTAVSNRESKSVEERQRGRSGMRGETG